MSYLTDREYSAIELRTMLISLDMEIIFIPDYIYE